MAKISKKAYKYIKEGDFMKTLLVPSAYYPSLGGVEELSKQLAYAFTKKHITTKIITSKPPKTKYKEDIEGIIVHRFHFYLPAKKVFNVLRFFILFPIELFRFWYITKTFNPDIIHIQCNSGNLYYANIVSQITKTPLFITSQGETLMDATKIYQKSAFMRNTLIKGLKNAAYVTGCSQATIDDISNNYFDVSNKSKTIFNGINPSEFDIKTESNTDEKYIFATGRISHNKGFDLLIDAYSEIIIGYPDIKLYIGGDGEDFEKLQQLIKTKNLTDKVNLLGRIDKNQTVTYMKNSLFVTMTSRYEPFGIVALEGLAAGKAVLVTSNGGPPEFITKDQGLIIDPNNKQIYVDKLKEMIKNSTTLEQNNNEYAKTFSWDKIANQYLTIYKAIQN
jgi:glycogen synthase